MGANFASEIVNKCRMENLYFAQKDTQKCLQPLAKPVTQCFAGGRRHFYYYTVVPVVLL